MTLIISVRIPDGIVIAGDSLSTVKGQDQTTVVTSLYTQKVFPFYVKFGVGTFGANLLVNKSMNFSMRLIEKKLKEEKTCFKGVAEAAERIANEFHKLLQEHLQLQKKSLNDLQPNQHAIGFHVVGYDNTEPKAVEVSIGRGVKTKYFEGFGCHISGSAEVARVFSELYKNESQKPAFHLFSLQDAIGYADFLINTTIAHQQFSQTASTVGGDIDIALVTYFNGFQWIRQKPLSKVLEENKNAACSRS